MNSDQTVKSDFLYLVIFVGLLAFFYPTLVLAKQASLVADHLEQHYPWAFAMADALRHGRVPFWTPLIQCGFPVIAESQMGFFYLPNLLLYTLLPIKWGYAYQNLFHFFLGGWGTYLYARKFGLMPVAAFTAMTIFVFGTGYGGAYYNITSLKTLTWFPWILWAFEGYGESFQKRYALLSVLFMSLSILAGYLQIAAMMLMISSIYFLLRVCVFQEKPRPWRDRLKPLGAMMLAMAGAVVLALPQLILTFELSLFSNRIDLSEGYAYVGSLLPFAVLTVVFPILQGLFRGACLYSGIFAIVFVMASFFITSAKLRKVFWLWFVLGTVSLLFAFGQWSPLYVGWVKLSHFYSFRIPAKFLIFFCFGFAILAGIGVHAIQEDLRKSDLKRNAFVDRFLVFVLSIFALWGAAFAFLTQGKPWIINSGKWAVANFFYGKPGHPKTLDSYFAGVNAAVDSARNMLTLSDPWQIWAVILLAVSCVWCIFFRRNFLSFLLLPIALVVLLTDFYVFADVDIKKDFATYQETLKPNIVLKTLLSEKEEGRLGRIYGFRKELDRLPIVPSVNMLYGLEDIGGYSPLIMSRYFETIGQFGNVNDSNRMIDPVPAFVLARLPLLNALDVSHIIAARELRDPSLDLLVRDPLSGVCLYYNLGRHARAFFVPREVVFSDWTNLKNALMAPGFDPQSALLLEDGEKKKNRGIRPDKDARAIRILRTGRDNGRESWLVETTGPGFFVIMNTMYPGWEARVNGKRSPILRAYGLFQALPISAAGTYSIELSYHPYHEIEREL
jgi:hypothetical protein